MKIENKFFVVMIMMLVWLLGLFIIARSNFQLIRVNLELIERNTEFIGRNTDLIGRNTDLIEAISKRIGGKGDG